MKQSAGLLLYRMSSSGVEVLLVHPGGPFWAKKDKGAWSLPKGEFTDEDGLAAAKREFQEELGIVAPVGDYRPLGSVKMSSKQVHAWCCEAEVDVTGFKGNEVEMEWPPKSGQMMSFPECDKAEWFLVPKARTKLHPVQADFLDRLVESLGATVDEPPAQISLF